MSNAQKAIQIKIDSETKLLEHMKADKVVTAMSHHQKRLAAGIKNSSGKIAKLKKKLAALTPAPKKGKGKAASKKKGKKKK